MLGGRAKRPALCWVVHTSYGADLDAEPLIIALGFGQACLSHHTKEVCFGSAFRMAFLLLLRPFDLWVMTHGSRTLGAIGLNPLGETDCLFTTKG